MKLRVVLAATLSVATTSVVASAQQPWIKDRRYGEGAGIRAGNLELHPGIAGEFGYDSNFLQRSDGPAEPNVPVYRLRLTPHLTLSTLGPQRRAGEGGPGAPPVFNFRAGVFGAFNRIIEADSGTLGDYNRWQVGAGANVAADILPERPVGFDVYGDWLRATEPSNQPEDLVDFRRNSFRGGAGVNWRPGGGLFAWRWGYEGQYHKFSRTAYESLDNSRHYIKTRASWRWLPRTAWIADADYGFIRYAQTTSSQNDGETVQGRLGLNGLVTNHFGVQALGGWGTTFFDRTATGVRAQNYDGPVGQAEVRWYIQPAPTLEATSASVGLSSIGLGATRTFATSYLSSFYVRNRAYMNVAYFLAGAFLVSVDAGYSIIQYPRSFNPDETIRVGAFDEQRIDAQLFGEYRFTDGFAINTTLRYDQNITDVAVPRGPGAPPDELEFQRFQAWVGLRAFW